jgi:ABC-type nickel/cobalt efflux system permease component RcnA
MPHCQYVSTIDTLNFQGEGEGGGWKPHTLLYGMKHHYFMLNQMLTSYDLDTRVQFRAQATILSVMGFWVMMLCGLVGGYQHSMRTYPPTPRPHTRTRAPPHTHARARTHARTHTHTHHCVIIQKTNTDNLKVMRTSHPENILDHYRIRYARGIQ